MIAKFLKWFFGKIKLTLFVNHSNMIIKISYGKKIIHERFISKRPVYYDKSLDMFHYHDL
jgi:hypothetical protein